MTTPSIDAAREAVERIHGTVHAGPGAEWSSLIPHLPTILSALAAVGRLPSDADTLEAMAQRHRPARHLLRAAAGIIRDIALAAGGKPEPCRIIEHDGAYKCLAHDRIWGAVLEPQEPCEGWKKEPADGQ